MQCRTEFNLPLLLDFLYSTSTLHKILLCDRVNEVSLTTATVRVDQRIVTQVLVVLCFMLTPVCEQCVVSQPMGCSVQVRSEIGILQQPNLTSYDSPSTWNPDSTGHISVTLCVLCSVDLSSTWLHIPLVSLRWSHSSCKSQWGADVPSAIWQEAVLTWNSAHSCLLGCRPRGPWGRLWGTTLRGFALPAICTRSMTHGSNLQVRKMKNTAAKVQLWKMGTLHVLSV